MVHAAIDQPETRNALGAAVREEIETLVGWLEREKSVRAFVFESAHGAFSSGGDLKSFISSMDAEVPAGEPDPVQIDNRSYGYLLRRIEKLPQVVVTVVEGPAFAGGLGLICASDVVIATADAQFAVSETSIGVVPGQIAPFLVKRIGLTNVRMLALTGSRFDGRRAGELGLANFVCDNGEAAQAKLKEVLGGIRRCAPGANAVTKQLLMRSLDIAALDETLDWAAEQFTAALRGPEAREGVGAFLEKRKPGWAAG
jgi:isohexenylglutaconyl-CoA hydratase